MDMGEIAAEHDSAHTKNPKTGGATTSQNTLQSNVSVSNTKAPGLAFIKAVSEAILIGVA